MTSKKLSARPTFKSKAVVRHLNRPDEPQRARVLTSPGLRGGSTPGTGTPPLTVAERLALRRRCYLGGVLHGSDEPQRRRTGRASQQFIAKSSEVYEISGLLGFAQKAASTHGGHKPLMLVLSKRPAS